MTGTDVLYLTDEHLNDDQLTDALIGDLAVEAAGHLAACAVCQQQLAEARMPLESFKAVTLAWSERRSATMPAALNARMLHGAIGSTGSRRLVWGSAIAALVAVMIAAPFEMHRGAPLQASTVETAQVQTAQAMGVTGVVSGQGRQSEIDPDQIDSDNQMLGEIDRELDSNRANSEAMAFQAIGEQASHHSAGRMLQD
jgi:hypothetical protein